jgi:diamine N-acetyltransferase
MITIQNARPSDIIVIRELAEKIWWPTYSPIVEKEQISFMLGTIYSAETIRNAIEDQSQLFILLYEENVPKGFASYGTWKEKPNTWKIHKLYVLPESHGKGFGRELLNEIKKRAKSNGVTTLVLNVNRKNPALKFYQRYGFSVLREEDIPVGPYWMNDYVMTLSLI